MAGDVDQAVDNAVVEDAVPARELNGGLAGVVDQAVDYAGVEDPAPVGDSQGRAHQDRAVKFIKIPLIPQKAMHACELNLGVGRVKHAPVIEQGREEQPEAADHIGQPFRHHVVLVDVLGELPVRQMEAFERGGGLGHLQESLVSAQVTQLGLPRRHAPGNHDAANGEDDERHCHRPRRLVGVLVDVLVARLAGEGHEPHTEHIKRREPRRNQRQKEKQEVFLVEKEERQRLGEDGILAVPAAKERNARDGQHAGHHGQRRGLHLGIKPAHFRHLLLVMAAVNDAARAEEEKGLEERMGQQVEDARNPAAHAQGQHHVAELADRRIGEDLLDVGHDDGDAGRDEDGDGAGVGNGQQDFQSEQRVTAPHEIDAGSHHGRRMDEGADWRRTLHGVGQPDM